MWLVADYLPTAPFSLRASNATNAAAKTLLLPSPYCVKMALLDASYRRNGVEVTESRFEWIRDLEIRFEVPQHAVGNNCFVKIQKWNGEAWGDTFALREYVFYEGVLKIAFRNVAHDLEWEQELTMLLLHIQHIGKRGCFFQLMEPPKTLDGELPDSFAMPISQEGLRSGTLLQPLDEMRNDASLAKVNNFIPANAKRKEIRVNVPTSVPYTRQSSSRSFSYFKR
jgi:hypothetical protein